VRFNRFYGDCPIKLFDGNNRITQYSQRPFDQRLNVRLEPNTFCYDESTQTLYFNGNVPYAGALWIDHIKDSPDIDEDTGWIFPSWSHPLLGFMAVAINKGGVDFDDINARMAPDNRAQANLIIQMLENRDNEMQLAAIATTDPYNRGGYPRAGAIDLGS